MPERVRPAAYSAAPRTSTRPAATHATASLPPLPRPPGWAQAPRPRRRLVGPGPISVRGPVPATPNRFRPELEGLRALAAGLVVVYHVWVGRVSGGVDVFFVLSGFLLLGGLARAGARGAIELGAHWARTLRRLVPTTMVVLGTSALVGAFVLPEIRWTQTIREVVASALFLQNWRLAADSVDYYAAHDRASIVQHLWSLSLQVQVALVLPVLVAALVALARVLRLDLRRVLLAATVALTAGSLAYSIVLTAADQQLAYFHSLTRLWEFTAGGVLALVIDRRPLPVRARVLLGWGGVLALVSCGVVLDVAGGFPGYLALWPVLAACAVLLAGRTGVPFGVDRLLASAPLQYLGRLAFPLYLWHWPVLTLGLVLTRRPEFGLWGGLAVVALSLTLAVLTHHGVELPVMRAPIGRFEPRGERRFVAVTLVPVLLIAMGWYSVAALMTEPELRAGDPGRPGASALAAETAAPAPVVAPGVAGGPSPTAVAAAPAAPAVPPPPPLYDPTQPLVPSPTVLGEDWAKPTDCDPARSDPDLQVCGPDGPRTGLRVLVIGDSHMTQFLPALEDGEAAGRWQVSSILEAACPMAVGSVTNPDDDACARHNDAALGEIAATRPDVVVLEATRNARPGRTEETPPEFVGMWRRIAALGIRMVAVRDNPRFDSSPSTCFLETPGPSCSAARADIYGPPPYLTVGAPPAVSFLDLADSYCTREVCPPVIGNVFVHLDDNHVTASYSRTLGPIVTREMTRLLGR